MLSIHHLTVSALCASVLALATTTTATAQATETDCPVLYAYHCVGGYYVDSSLPGGVYSFTPNRSLGLRAEATARQVQEPDYACYGAGKKRFTGTWRTNQQNAFRYFAANICIFFRRLQEVYNFNKFFFGFVNAGNIAEPGFDLAFFNCTVAAAACTKQTHAAHTAAAHFLEQQSRKKIKKY